MTEFQVFQQDSKISLVYSSRINMLDIFLLRNSCSEVLFKTCVLKRLAKPLENTWYEFTLTEKVKIN